MKPEPMTDDELTLLFADKIGFGDSDLQEVNRGDLVSISRAVEAFLLAQWQAAIAEQPATQYCWLVENGKQAGQGLAYRTMEQGWPEWTEDPQKAIRFSRRDDAEMFAQEDEDAWRIVEHGFESPDAALPPKAEPAPHARDAITWTPETGYVFATEASKPVQDHIDTPINMVATKQAEAPTASIERERADFEIELRKQCFQMPTPEAFDLAWSMWKARAAQQEAPTASNAQAWDSNPEGIQPGQDSPVRMNAGTGAFDAPEDYEGRDGSNPSNAGEMIAPVQTAQRAGAPHPSQECMNCGGSGIDPDTLGTCPACYGARAALATQQEAQPQADPDAAAKVMYAKHPTYRGTMALPWEAAPDLVRQEWREKAARAVPAGGDKEDADKYRLIRRGQHWSVIDGIGNTLRGDDLDAAVDAIRAARAAQQATGERG